MRETRLRAVITQAEVGLQAFDAVAAALIAGFRDRVAEQIIGRSRMTLLTDQVNTGLVGCS